MFGMSKAPNYRRASGEVAATCSDPRRRLGEVLGKDVPAYRGEGQPTSTRPGWFGLFPGTPAYRTAPPPAPQAPPCLELEEAVLEEAAVCPEEGPSLEEGQVNCNAPVTIVIQRRE
jgi:hypothetical protein